MQSSSQTFPIFNTGGSTILRSPESLPVSVKHIFFETIDFDGRAVSAFALTSEKGLGGNNWKKADEFQCVLLGSESQVDEIPSLGFAVHASMMCLCIPNQGTTVAFSELGLDSLGQLISRLETAYASGTLDPVSVDIENLRKCGDGFILLARSEKKQVSNGVSHGVASLLAMQAQRRILSNNILLLLDIERHGDYIQQVIGGASELVPELRRFITGHAVKKSHEAGLESVVQAELRSWAAAAGVLSSGNALVHLSRTSLNVARSRDAIVVTFNRFTDRLSRHTLPMVALALLVVLAASIGIPLARRRFGAPLSAGLSAVELVERYGNALASLDMPFIDSVLRSPEGPPYRRDLYALAAMAAMRRGLPGTIPVAADNPDSPEPAELPLWNLTGFSIWNLNLVSDVVAKADVGYLLASGDVMERRIDHLNLQRLNGSWIITKHTSSIAP